MNPLLFALVNSGIVDRSTADLVDRQTNPLEAQLYAEQVLQQAMRSGLLAQQIRYIDLVNAAQGKPSEEQLALFWQDENEALFRDIEGALVQVASDRAVQIGIAMGGDEMWAVVNEQVIDWVGDYYQSFDPSFVGSVPNLNVTARTIVGQATNEWQRGELEGAGEADGLPQLIRALEPAFGAQRADRISVTEVTRIFSEATIAAGQANPLITRYRWYSAADDRVCFPADTLVETGRGGKPIQDVRIGDSVLTRKGVRRVLAVSERKYNGAMVTVDTSVGSVTATAEHPFWTLEQGWLEGHNLNIGHTLQTFGKQDVQVLGVLNFDIRDSANTETVRLKERSLSGVPFGVRMPVNAIDLDSNTQIEKQKIDGISSHLRFLGVGYPHAFQRLAHSFFKSVFSTKATIAGETAKLAMAFGFNSDGLLALPALFDYRWSSAFLRTEVAAIPFIASEYLPASFTGDIRRVGSSAFDRANSIPVSNLDGDLKLLQANRASLCNQFGGSTSFVAFLSAELTALIGLRSCDAFTTSDAKGWRNGFGRSPTFCRTVFMRTLRGLIKFPAVWALLSKHIDSVSDCIQRLIALYHNRSNDAIMVYNLEVEDVPEFYANGILVHNCPICGPLHNQLSSANKSAPAWQHPTLGVVNIPPAHVNCRCQPVPETEVTLQFESDLPRPYTWSPETPTEYAKRRRDELNAERR